MGADWGGMLGELSQEGFERPAGALTLPDDHGAHPGAFTETWTISAQLHDGRGEDLGVQFTLSRVGLKPASAQRPSTWDPHAVYRAHITLVDAAQASAVSEERFQRDVPGLAGHDGASREVWIDDWSMRYGEGEGGEVLTLAASANGRKLDLTLTPVKDVVNPDPGGGSAPVRGYAITRMAVEGFVGNGRAQRAVSGTAWLDHLWGDVPLPVGPIASDRLLLQLDDGTDLSVTRSRRRDGGGSPTVAGFVVEPGGEVRQLGEDAEMEATRNRRGNAACDGYPRDWQLAADDLELAIAPLVEDQDHAFAAPFWSGAVTAEGSRGGARVSGQGTLLLTGYADQ